MKFYVDKLNSRYSYPCTVKEIKGFLTRIPPDDLCGVKSIRLSNQKINSDGGYIFDGRIELVYFVDKQLRKELYGNIAGIPYEDTKRFGGILTDFDGRLFVCWKKKNLKDYVAFILYHEIGHHVHKQKFGIQAESKEQEKFCTDYAMRHLKL